MINRIKENIYKKHLGLVFKLKSEFQFQSKNMRPNYVHQISESSAEILRFYKKVGYSHYTEESITNSLNNNVVFYCIKDENKIIAITAIFYGEAQNEGLSFYALLEVKKSKLVLNKGTVYAGMVVVDPDYRGNNLFVSLMAFIMDKLVSEGIHTVILTTGVGNTPMIKSLFSMNANLIEIVEIRRLFRFFIKKQRLFKSSKEQYWISV